MASSSSTTSARRARDARHRAGTPRWDGGKAIDLAGRGVRPTRRRRLLTRMVPVIVVIAAVPFVVGWVGGGYMSPEKVAQKAHDPVQREAIDRTGDYSITIGALTCTEIQPGKGNCLGSYRSSTHIADDLMVAAAYDLTQGDHDMHLVVKLP